MTTSFADRYRLWFDYEKDSHAKTLASLQSVPEDKRGSEAFRKAVYLMFHIVAARRMWLFRFGVTKEKIELFPAETNLADLPSLLAQMESSWSDYLSRLTEEEIARVFEYESYDGFRFRNTIDEILTQLFGHSWYHRGQIAQLVRSLGAEPAVTDFVYWSRQPIA